MQGAKTYWFEQWKAHDTLKKDAVKVFLEIALITSALPNSPDLKPIDFGIPVPTPGGNCIPRLKGSQSWFFEKSHCWGVE